MLNENDFKNMCGSGGTDIGGDWVWSGNYYIYIMRPKTNHNYYINFYRSYGSTGRTKGWRASICQSLNCCNSGEVRVDICKARTLKATIQKVVETVNEYDKKEKPKLMVDWLNHYRQAVFIIRDSIPIIIGESFGSTGCDMDNFFDKDKMNRWRYYHTNMPNYNKYSHVFTLHKDRRNDSEYLWQDKRHGGGRSASGIKDEELIEMGINIPREEFMDIIRDLHETYKNDRYIANIRQKT